MGKQENGYVVFVHIHTHSVHFQKMGTDEEYNGCE